MLIFLVFNFLFNRSTNFFKKQYKSYIRYKELIFLRDIFEDLKEKFNCYNIELLVNPSNNINAYAVGGMRQQVIIINIGLIRHYRENSKSQQEFLQHIKGILAHEFSHIINKDYFCGLLLLINERSLNIILKVILFVCKFLTKIISYIPLIGKSLTSIVNIIYKTIDYIINFFYFNSLIKIYNFCQIQISKYIEFRADRQAGNVIGGKNMANTLSFLGKSGWFNIFSSHPKTQNRIKKVLPIKVNYQCIKPVIGTNLLFYLSIFMMCFLTYKSYNLINHNQIKNNYYQIQNSIKNWQQIIKSKIRTFINNNNGRIGGK